jgi:asparagine synthase (glutamine-hydrolysing)
MCGICGIARPTFQHDATALVQTMSRTMRHRGPDQEGIEELGEATLGFQRLAIIDLSGGSQPMSNEDDSAWIVFNGEIYNFQALREQILATGRHQFKTRSDTEVILHLYEEYGEDCPNYLRGMFSFAIWDKKRRRLFAARDRFGKKPFVYFTAPGGELVFASELKALLRHPQCPQDVDLAAVSLYLSFQYVPSPHTIFSGVRKLPPAHSLTWSAAEGVRIRRYWDLRFEPKASLPYAEAREELRRRVDESVRLRMIADVPLGAFLSGGIDSSIVVASMARQSGRRIQTFCIGFEEDDFSELHYARAVATRYNTDHHEFVVRPELIDVLPKLAWYYSEPFADSSALPSYYLTRETRRHVTVALNGDGGDEVFGGYLRYRAMWLLAQAGRLPIGFRRRMVALGKRLPGALFPGRWHQRVQRLLHVAAEPYSAQYFQTLYYIAQDDQANLWRPELWQSLQSAGVHPVQELDRVLARYAPAHWLDQLLYLDLNLYLPECLMVKMDIASMANSLETRSPFLDHELVEACARWPASWKFRAPNQSKVILRDAFAEDLPPLIRGRGKQGFGVPIQRWFRGPLAGFLREMLLSQGALTRQYFRPEAVQRMVDEHQSGTKDRAYGLWALVMLELWHREFRASKT